jgi:hypothetical protein
MGDSFIYTKIGFIALLLTSLSSHYEWSSIALQQADTLKHNQIPAQDKKTQRQSSKNERSNLLIQHLLINSDSFKSPASRNYADNLLMFFSKNTTV